MKPFELKYIDIHCHLNFPEYEADIDDVVMRARDAGVGMIVVGTGKETSVRAVELAQKYDNIWAIIGLHPVHAHEEVKSDSGVRFDRDLYLELAKHPKVVGIGECGYDFFRSEATAEIIAAQDEAFRGQIDIAHEVEKPLMLHLRNDMKGSGPHGKSAYAEAIEVLRSLNGGSGPKIAGDAHFFAGTTDEAKAFFGLGFNISFTGVITFAKSYDEVVRLAPADRIMSETDAPFVTPVPHRGERNEPFFVIEVAHRIAALRGAIPGSDAEQAMLKQLVDNARKLFSI
ncbi:MAG: sec-independent protein translocase protein TatD DNase family protein [Candidatus Taylorbacteria bacterium]|nr:sec-independent protein translocase protein TatD DNase family protein [Candidatus Taylorbacteria bacterium]